MKNPYNSLPLTAKILITIVGIGLVIAVLWDYFGGG